MVHRTHMVTAFKTSPTILHRGKSNERLGLSILGQFFRLFATPEVRKVTHVLSQKAHMYTSIMSNSIFSLKVVDPRKLDLRQK